MGSHAGILNHGQNARATTQEKYTYDDLRAREGNR